jgi:hypothetical protein
MSSARRHAGVVVALLCLAFAFLAPDHALTTSAGWPASPSSYTYDSAAPPSSAPTLTHASTGDASTVAGTTSESAKHSAVQRRPESAPGFAADTALDEGANAGRLASTVAQSATGDAARASDVAAEDASGGSRLVDSAVRRVKLRTSTKEAIEDAAPKTAEGDFIDPNTGQVVPKEGPFHYGHQPGYEWWRTQQMAREGGWTRQDVIEFENDPSHYQIEDPYSNMSHRYEMGA